MDFEIQIPECPEFLEFITFDHGSAAQHIPALAQQTAGAARKDVPQGFVTLALSLVTDGEFLAETFSADDDIFHRHTRSANARSVCRNRRIPHQRKNAATPRLAMKPGP